MKVLSTLIFISVIRESVWYSLCWEVLAEVQAIKGLVYIRDRGRLLTVDALIDFIVCVFAAHKPVEHF